MGSNRLRLSAPKEAVNVALSASLSSDRGSHRSHCARQPNGRHRRAAIFRYRGLHSGSKRSEAAENSREVVMAKYMITGTYTADGLKGLYRDRASGRVPPCSPPLWRSMQT